MPLYQGKSIILKSLNVGESDLLITYFSEDWGKIKVFVKNARSARNRNWASLMPLNHVETVLFGKENRPLFRLNSCDILNPFPGLRSDLPSLFAALYLVDLVEALSPEGEANKPVFDLLLETLSFIEEFGSQKTILRFFEMRFLDFVGYRLEIDKCLYCKNPCAPIAAKFSPMGSGIVCSACSRNSKEITAISPGALKFMRIGLSFPMEKGLRLKLSSSQHEELERLLHLCLRHHSARNFRSRPF